MSKIFLKVSVLSLGMMMGMGSIIDTAVAQGVVNPAQSRGLGARLKQGMQNRGAQAQQQGYGAQAQQPPRRGLGSRLGGLAQGLGGGQQQQGYDAQGGMQNTPQVDAQGMPIAQHPGMLSNIVNSGLFQKGLGVAKNAIGGAFNGAMGAVSGQPMGEDDARTAYNNAETQRNTQTFLKLSNIDARLQEQEKKTNLLLNMIKSLKGYDQYDIQYPSEGGYPPGQQPLEEYPSQNFQNEEVVSE